jgi:ankyrin repeat protein
VSGVLLPMPLEGAMNLRQVWDQRARPAHDRPGGLDAQGYDIYGRDVWGFDKAGYNGYGLAVDRFPSRGADSRDRDGFKRTGDHLLHNVVRQGLLPQLHTLLNTKPPAGGTGREGGREAAPSAGDSKRSSPAADVGVAETPVERLTRLGLEEETVNWKPVDGRPLSVNVCTKNADQQTAVHVAVRARTANMADILTALVKAGANINAKNGAGETALDLAYQADDIKLVEHLKGLKAVAATNAAEDYARRLERRQRYESAAAQPQPAPLGRFM